MEELPKAVAALRLQAAQTTDPASNLCLGDAISALRAQKYRNQWSRKITKDLLSVYPDNDSASSAASPSKAASPTKRKRKEE